MDFSELFADNNTTSMFPFSDSDNEDIDTDEQFSELDFIRETIKKENLFPSITFSSPAPLSTPPVSAGNHAFAVHTPASYAAAAAPSAFPNSSSSSSAVADYINAGGGVPMDVSSAAALEMDYHHRTGNSPLRSPTLDFLYGEDGVFQNGPSSGHSSGSEGSATSHHRRAFPSGSASPHKRLPSTINGIPFSASASAPKKGGRKKGSSIQCDENLIMRLLPMSTKLFNQEIKTLDLTQEEVKKLKFARRRIKNARAAQNRRSKLITSLQGLQKKVDYLTRENTDLHRRLNEVLSENNSLKNLCNNHQLALPTTTTTTTNHPPVPVLPTPNNINLLHHTREQQGAPGRISEVDHVPQLR